MKWPLRVVAGAGIASLAYVLGWVATIPGLVRIGLAVTLGVLAVAVGFHKPSLLALGTLLCLPFLGSVRRLLTEFFGPSPNDTLLLIAPTATVFLLLGAGREGFGRMTRLGYFLLAFNALTFLSALNPLQGGLAVGLGGLLFLLLPQIWFWIGRGLLGAGQLRRLLGWLPFIAASIAIYGLFQTFSGFPRFDQKWIEENGYIALNIKGTIRAFGTFSSSAEYAMFLSIGLVLLWAFPKRKPAWVAIVPVMLVTATALVLNSGRNSVVLCVLALAAVTAARRRVGRSTALLLGAACLATLSFGLQRIDVRTFQDPRTAGLLQHQVEGLANPLDKQKSTLGVHRNLAVSGLSGLLDYPLGFGPGAVTIAGSKFGGATTGTEVDISNVAVALGVPGLVLFVYIAGSGLLLAYRKARTRDPIALAALGILVVTGMQWLNGGQYAVAPLPWLVLGWLDRQAADEKDLADAQVANPLDRGAANSPRKGISQGDRPPSPAGPQPKIPELTAAVE